LREVRRTRIRISLLVRDMGMDIESLFVVCIILRVWRIWWLCE
jgi:hypothetical protein